MSTTPEQRAFFQERLAYFGKMGFLFSASFFAVFNLVEILEHPQSWLTWVAANRNNQFHVGLTLVLLATWMSCRRGPLSPRTAAWIEAFTLWGVCLAAILPVWFPEATVERKFAMLLEVTIVLMARAVIVPSTPQRTLLLGVPVVAAVLVVTYLHADHTGMSASALKRVFEAGVFVALALGVATVASRVIYGLRREVREARKLGQYVLEEMLGSGGMGVVYKARHALLRRPTAVKLLRRDRVGEDRIRRFEREVQLTSQLTHPNTVAIYDYGRTPDGVFYYAMELLDGLNLHELVRAEGPQAPGRVAHIVKQVCAALCEAHGLGLVHGDIKPANLMLCERWAAPDVVKVVDFGLVKEVAGARSDVTADHAVVGTPHYIAPEAIRLPDSAGPPADIYAVGAVAYYLACGRTVFDDGELFEILERHVTDAPVPPSTRLGRPISSKLDAVILRCLEKDPAARPTASILLADLAGVDDVAPWTDEHARRWWSEHRKRAASHAASTSGISLSDLPTAPVRYAPGSTLDRV